MPTLPGFGRPSGPAGNHRLLTNTYRGAQKPPRYPSEARVMAWTMQNTITITITSEIMATIRLSPSSCGS